MTKMNPKKTKKEEAPLEIEKLGLTISESLKAQALDENYILRGIASGLTGQDYIKVDFDPYAFFMDNGIMLPPKPKQFVKFVLDAAAAKQKVRVVVKATRGGGKTKITSALEFVLFYQHDYDFVNLGGSQHQAETAYEYMHGFFMIPEVAKAMHKTLQSESKKFNGTWIKVLAASEKKTRTKHVGNKNKGGGLVIDEEAEADERIVKSALPIVINANPSIVMRISTDHKEASSFQQLVENSGKRGYKLFQWDAFDVCSKCTRDCRISYKDDPANGCVDQFRMDVFDDVGRRQSEGYCKGKAHQTGKVWEVNAQGQWIEQDKPELKWDEGVEGWIDVGELITQWDDMDQATFETEYVGKRARRTGRVYDPNQLDAAVMDNFDLPEHTMRSLEEKTLGIDWGFTNQTFTVYGFRYNKKVYLYWMEYYVNKKLDYIIGEVDRRCREDGHVDCQADAAGKFENAALGDKLLVKEIPFGEWKEFGIGNVRNYLEKERLVILRNWRGRPNPGFEEWMSQMKGYEYGPDGKAVKKNDHGPDATLCALLKWFRARPTKAKMAQQFAEPRMHVI